MSDDGGITRLSIGFNKIVAVIKVAPRLSKLPHFTVPYVHCPNSNLALVSTLMLEVKVKIFSKNLQSTVTILKHFFC